MNRACGEESWQNTWRGILATASQPMRILVKVSMVSRSGGSWLLSSAVCVCGILGPFCFSSPNMPSQVSIKRAHTNRHFLSIKFYRRAAKLLRVYIVHSNCCLWQQVWVAQEVPWITVPKVFITRLLRKGLSTSTVSYDELSLVSTSQRMSRLFWTWRIATLCLNSSTRIYSSFNRTKYMF